MELIEQEGRWFWINHDKLTVSPSYPTRELAEEWYNLHDSWLERPAIIR